MFYSIKRTSALLGVKYGAKLCAGKTDGIRTYETALQQAEQNVRTVRRGGEEALVANMQVQENAQG